MADTVNNSSNAAADAARRAAEAAARRAAQEAAARQQQQAQQSQQAQQAQAQQAQAPAVDAANVANRQAERGAELQRFAAQQPASTATTTAQQAPAQPGRSAPSPTQLDALYAPGTSATPATTPATATAATPAAQTRALTGAPETPLSDKSKAALAPNATVEQRRAAADQFQGGGFLGFGGDRTVDKADAQQALLLHQSERMRADRDPETMGKLEEQLRTGVQQLSESKDPADREYAKKLAGDLANNSAMEPQTRIEAFETANRLDGLTDRAGIPPPGRAEEFATKARAFFEDLNKDPRAQNGNDMFARDKAVRGIYEAAKDWKGDKRARLLDAGDALSRNLPTDPGERAVVEKLASGEIKPEMLSRNESQRALDLLNRYPPRAGIMNMGSRPDAAQENLQKSQDQGFARIDAKNALEERTKDLDKLYAKNGWTKDTDLQPGTKESPSPAQDQAVLLDIADRARGATPQGQELNAQSYKGISYGDTRKGLQAIDNIKAANPSVFGDPPPTDAASLETRNRIGAMERDLHRNEAIQAATLQVDALESRFDKILQDRGVVGKFADFVKNTAGMETGSDAVAKDIKSVAEARNRLDALRNFQGDDKAFAAAYQKETGALANKLEDVKGHVEKFVDSQRQWVDTITDIGAGVAGVAAAAAAPVTFGGSLLVGGAVAAATKVGGKALDAATGSGKYDGSILGDAAVGFLAGASGAGALKVGQMAGSALAARLGSSAAARIAAGLGADALAGSVDGAVTGAGTTAIRGGSGQEILQNGVRGAAIGALVGPLVGGTTRAVSSIAKAVREGASVPSRVAFAEAGEVAKAQLERAGVKGDLGNIEAKALPENGTPYTRMKPDGSVEVGLPVARDGTVSRASLAHEAEHLKQISLARQTGDAALVENLQKAERQAAEVASLEKQHASATGAEKERVAQQLERARSEYANNPVEREARAAGLGAEADALEKAGKVDLANRLRDRAAALRQGKNPSATTPDAATARAEQPTELRLAENPASADAEMKAFLRDEAQGIRGKMDELGKRADQNGGVLTPQAKQELDKLAQDAKALAELATEKKTSLSELLGDPPRADVTAGANAQRALADVQKGLQANQRSVTATVKTEQEAREVLNEMLKQQSLVNTTGLNARIGREIMGSNGASYHWDTELTGKLASNGKPIIKGHEQAALTPQGLKDATTPHLQIQLPDGTDVRVFIEGGAG